MIDTLTHFYHSVQDLEIALVSDETLYFYLGITV